MIGDPPDPMDDPVGYGLWCELHACTYCDGIGDDYIEDDDSVWVCPHCNGTGLEPDTGQ